MDLVGWSWTFLLLYIALMVGIGLVGQRRVSTADDFATARSSYGPLFLAFAFAATVASGATFLGLPGISYTAGLSAIWSSVLYPVGVYLGVLICIRLVRRAGHVYGSRSIPEYLGERYDSDLIRILVSIFSLLLLFYLAGQLVAGLVMFEMMLGLSSAWALLITGGVLLIYVVLGGAHADILTDGIQGAVMVVLAIGTIALFAVAYGVDGGFPGLVQNLKQQDPNLVRVINPTYVLYHSWWAILAIVLSHLPLGLLPHLGNKIWALQSDRDRIRFVIFASLLGFMIAGLGVGGILARGVLGPELSNGNLALPALFIELFPGWFAALIGVGILAAVMSTADGLVVSSSQIIANDLYRCTIVPRFRKNLADAVVDRHVLLLSRVSTVVVMLLCTALAWALQDTNIALLVWIGNGGLMAAFAGPLVLGSLWSGVTRAGALWGLVSGAAVFGITHAGLIQPEQFGPGTLQSVAAWLAAEAPNPWSCASMGEIVSVAVTWSVSKLTQPLPAEHLEQLFADQG